MSKPPAKPPSAPDTGTLPDEIPPVHVLEAAQAQDRKEAEDLLSGFNRPGREPKRPLEERDFVDYYTRKSGAPDRPREDRPRPPAKSAAPTVLKPRWDERPPREMPPWAAWVGVGLLMMAIGGTVAFIATSEPSQPAKSAATTITGASTATPLTSRDAIPPPPAAGATADPTAMTTTPITVASPSAASRTKRDRHSAPTTSDPPPIAAPARTQPLPAAGANTTGPTRDDLIRDM